MRTTTDSITETETPPDNLNADGEFFVTVKEDVALVKPEGSAWIDSDTLAETSFHWQDLECPAGSNDVNS
jgi:hypothetical protein